MEYISYLAEHAELSDKAADELQKGCIRKAYKKNDIIIKPGNYSKSICFIESGLARIFYYHQNRDITFHFLEENGNFLAIDAVYYYQKSPYGLQALSDITITSIAYDKFEAILGICPPLEKYCRYLLIDYLKVVSEKLNAIQFHQPQERFKHLMQTNPLLFNKAPLGHIASYLGIAQETLSRLRSKSATDF